MELLYSFLKCIDWFSIHEAEMRLRVSLSRNFEIWNPIHDISKTFNSLSFPSRVGLLPPTKFTLLVFWEWHINSNLFELSLCLKVGISRHTADWLNSVISFRTSFLTDTFDIRTVGWIELELQWYVTSTSLKKTNRTEAGLIKMVIPLYFYFK